MNTIGFVDNLKKKMIFYYKLLGFFYCIIFITNFYEENIINNGDTNDYNSIITDRI